MEFQTKISLTKQADNLIDYNSKLLLLGSCFVENIGQKLDYFKFQNSINPFGILFHPKGIESFIENVINEKEFTEADVFYHNEQWHCFNAHSKLSDSSKENLLKVLNENITSSKLGLQESTHIIITLGTAWVYKHIETGKIVSNCHKIPQDRFLKDLLSIKTIHKSLSDILANIRKLNSKAQVIFTVSPVRHLKDGFIENTQSKSHLISAVHKVVDKELNTRYFPSFEIMMDELRDYRFYNEDMIHPSTTAINYIWEKFRKVWISSAIAEDMNLVDAIQKGLLHRPFNQNSKSHQQFLNDLDRKVKSLEQKYDHMSFSNILKK